MTDHPRITPQNAWAWIGICFSLALNLLAGWIVVQAVNRPDAPLLAPPAVERSK